MIQYRTFGQGIVINWSGKAREKHYPHFAKLNQLPTTANLQKTRVGTDSPTFLLIRQCIHERNIFKARLITDGVPPGESRVRER